MRCAGILLTGGASRRFGSDKARAVVQGEALAVRLATMLSLVTEPCVEVGPGGSGLAAIEDDREGPLAAIGAGWEAVPGCDGALVLACDLPLVSTGLLEWLAHYPGATSVVPLAGSPLEPQPLCARWSAQALGAVPAILAAGERSMRPLLAAGDVVLVDPSHWTADAGPAGAAALDDADTPSELARLIRLLGDRP